MSQRPLFDVDDAASRTFWRVAAVLAGMAVTWAWGSVGLSVLLAQEPPSARGAISSLAFAVAGIGVGVLVGLGSAWYGRRRGHAVPAPALEDMGLAQLLMGLSAVGWGTGAILQTVPTGWGVLSPLHFSGVGGFLIGLALVAGIGSLQRGSSA